MIEISHLVKKYGGHYAVKDLSVTIEKGKIYGFLGPNGAGKSTTMNIITGYLAPTAGTVKVAGYDIMKEPQEAKKHIGYLPEIPPLYPDMTVIEYLKFAAQLKKIPKAQRADSVEKAINATQLDDMRNRLIANLSKGYKQRVGLAQAMLGDPDIIILDEPTVGLDPKQIIEIRELITSLKENHTVILSSHILSEVSAVCDHILIISKGQLVAGDTPEALLEKMQGASSLELNVKGGQKALEEVLSQLPGAAKYSCKELDDGSVCAYITEEKECDVREELFYALAQHQLPILSLNRKKESLEDVFLQLTDASAAGSADKNTADGAESADIGGELSAQIDDILAEANTEAVIGEEENHDSDL